MLGLNLDINKKYSLSTSAKIDLDFIYKQYPQADWESRHSPEGSIISLPVGGHKPEGLWYAFGREWLDFEAKAREGYAADDNIPSSLFLLDIDTTNFAKLTCSRDVEKFHDQYVVDSDDHVINWLEVSHHYDGLEVLPFDGIFSDFYWYKSFEISSGCIWNLRKVTNIKQILG